MKKNIIILSIIMSQIIWPAFCFDGNLSQEVDIKGDWTICYDMTIHVSNIERMEKYGHFGAEPYSTYNENPLVTSLRFGEKDLGEYFDMNNNSKGYFLYHLSHWDEQQNLSVRSFGPLPEYNKLFNAGENKRLLFETRFSGWAAPDRYLEKIYFNVMYLSSNEVCKWMEEFEDINSLSAFLEGSWTCVNKLDILNIYEYGGTYYKEVDISKLIFQFVDPYNMNWITNEDEYQLKYDLSNDDLLNLNMSQDGQFISNYQVIPIDDESMVLVQGGFVDEYNQFYMFFFNKIN